MKISPSSTNAFKSCRRKYLYYKTIKFNDSLSFNFGKAFEEGLETYVKTGKKSQAVKSALSIFNKDIKKIVIDELTKKKRLKREKIIKKEINDEAKTLISDAKELLPEMIERAKVKLDSMGIIFVDHQIVMSMQLDNNNNTVEGRFDGLVEMDGKRYIYELKSYKNMKNREDLEVDNQLTTYALIAREKGLEIDGIMFHQNKKVKLEEPKLIKNGKELSTAKTQKCDPEEYIKKARELYSEIPDKVIETYEELKSKYELSKIDIITFDNNRLDAHKSQLEVVSEEMGVISSKIDNGERGLNAICYQNFGQACMMCNYEEICRNDI